MPNPKIQQVQTGRLAVSWFDLACAFTTCAISAESRRVGLVWLTWTTGRPARRACELNSTELNIRAPHSYRPRLGLLVEVRGSPLRGYFVPGRDGTGPGLFKKIRVVVVFVSRNLPVVGGGLRPPTPPLAPPAQELP